MTSEVIAYCRAGFEADTAEELASIASGYEVYGYPQLQSGQGYVRYLCYEPQGARQLCQQLKVQDTVFARQLWQLLAVCQFDNKHDRVGDIIAALTDSDSLTFGQLWVEFPDTDEGKPLAKLCRKLAVPLRKTLRTKGFLSASPQMTAPCLHVFFLDFDRCLLGVSMPSHHAPYENGICRLKFPHGAPSRSTLKLEEALVSMMNTVEAERLCPAGAVAVDLGACPGGWTYQLVRRHMRVEAVDNGAIDEALMATGLVSHFRADGFSYRPKGAGVQLLVCDMIEQPLRVAKLMGEWLRKGWAQHAVFNLKLPMKKRVACVQEALQLLAVQLTQSDKQYDIRCRHLYHDRDEVTVVVLQIKR